MRFAALIISLAALHAQMQKLRVDKCPFTNLPVPRNSRWGGGVTAECP